MKSSIILIKTLLKSTSRFNVCKYTTDEKKKKKTIASLIGVTLLYVFIMGYCILMCVGYGLNGSIESVPVMCAMIISIIAFVFTLLKTNGYLFKFKEYDMLMSLPFDVRTVAACKFLYMYIKSLPWYLSVSVAIMIGYGTYAKIQVYVYIIWIILSFILPIIPMLIAAFFGFLIAKISSGFRKGNLIQTVLIFIFAIFCFCLRFIINAVIKNDEVEKVLAKTSEITDSIAGFYLPARWFAKAITKHSMLDMFILIVLSVALFTVLFYFVGKSYRKINSNLKSHAAAKNYKMTAQKKHSVINIIAYKEFKRMTGSTAYMTNVVLGEILASLLGIVTLIVGFDKIVAVVTQDAPFDAAILQPSIPFIVYFFIGMLATTVCSPSLEGKNYWIMQSLPIEKKTMYQGKMLFNMYLTVPFMSFAIICMCISAKVPVINTVLYLILGFLLCAFSTARGCVCGVKHMHLDWENEIEVIKQGSAVTIYMLPNMFVTMAVVVFVVFLGMFMDHKLLTLIFSFIISLLAFLYYMRVMILAKRR